MLNTKHFYDLESIERELFEVVKKYDIPYEILDSALIDVRQNAIKYFNKKRAEN